jgi:hypothetical protein
LNRTNKSEVCRITDPSRANSDLVKAIITVRSHDRACQAPARAFVHVI